MSINTAAGYPQYSGSPTNYIPKLYAKKVLADYYDASVVPQISFSDPGASIKDMGDEVVIRRRPRVTVRDYVKGGTLVTESVQQDSVSLLIDKGKYYSVGIDDVDEKQIDIMLSKETTAGAAEDMSIAIDTDILAGIFGSVSADNQGTTAGRKSNDINLGISGTPRQITKSNILDWTTDMQVVLDEQNVPMNDRWLVMPPKFCGLLQKSDLKNASFAGDGKSVLLRGGYVGSLSGFKVYSSNLLTTTTDGANTVSNIVFGHKDSLCFATQLVKNRIIEQTNTFGKKMEGLYVFGYKVVRPEGMGWSYVYAG